MNRLSKAKAVAILREQIKAIPEIKQEPLMAHSSLFQKWLNDTETAISEIFKDNRSPQLRNLQWHLGFDPTDFASKLSSAEAELESMVTEIERFWDEETIPSGIERRGSPAANELFIIHGRDESARDALVGFIRQLGLKPVILADQPSDGMTIIEKFERHSEVGFAIALLTPDDVVSSQVGEHPEARARQNVIFELGFFVGRFGRSSVCALTKGEPEIPSDYSGVVYIPMESPSDWKLPLMRELKSFGFDVDANQAL